jgi:hypothetical protein
MNLKFIKIDASITERKQSVLLEISAKINIGIWSCFLEQNVCIFFVLLYQLIWSCSDCLRTVLL